MIKDKIVRLCRGVRTKMSFCIKEGHISDSYTLLMCSHLAKDLFLRIGRKMMSVGRVR